MKKLPLFILIGLLGSLFLLTLPYGSVLWSSASFSKAVASDIAPESLAESAWPCRGHDPKHTGLSLYQGSQTDALKWNCQTGGGVHSSPAIGPDATVYIGSADGRVYALDQRNGSVKWSYQTGDNVYSSPAIASDGTIYVGSLDNYVYALKPDGSLKWKFKTGKEVYSSPAIGADGTVYIGSMDGRLYALDPQGNLKGSYQTGGDIYSSPAIGTDGTIYVGSLDGYVYALKPQPLPLDGAAGQGATVAAGFYLEWKYQTGYWIDSSPAIGADGTIYVGSLDGRVYALMPQPSAGAGASVAAGCSLKWSYKTGEKIESSPAIGADGTIYVGSLDSRVYALNPQGKLKWSYKTGAGVSSSPAIGADGTIYVGSLDYGVYALNPESGGLKWSYKTLAGVSSSPAIGVDGTVYIGSQDGRVYAFASPEGLTASSWPCWRLDSKHTGKSRFNGTQTNTLKWSCQPGSQIFSSPAIGAAGTIYIGSYDSRIYALNPEGGGQKWSYKTENCVFSSPAIGYDGTIYAGSLDGSIYAIDSQDGSKKWSCKTGAQIYSSPAVGPEGTVYIGSLDSNVYALNSDGSQKWTFPTGDRIYSSPAIGADGIVYIGSYDRNVYAIDAQTGSPKWSYQTQDAVYSSPAIADDGTIYVGGLDGYVYALKSQNGEVKWSYKTGGAIYSSPAIGSDGVVYIGSLDHYVYAINGQDSRLKWKFETGAEVYSSPAISADDTVYIGSLDGMIYALQCQDAVLKWSYQTGSQGTSTAQGGYVTGINSSPAIDADGTVYIANSCGKIYAFNSAKSGISQGNTVIDDQQFKAPQISCPADMTVPATGIKTKVYFTATAADDVDSNPVIAYSLKPGSEFSLGTAVVKVTATDSSGKSSTCSFQVTVKDSEPPAIICPPLDSITVSATGPKTIVNFKVEATDNVDLNPRVVYDHEPGSEFSPGTEMVKVIATDSSNNSSTCYFRVTVKDTEPPKITCPVTPDATIFSATGIKTPVSFTVTARDNVDPNPEIVCDPPSGSGFPVGTTRVMVTAADNSKNSSVTSFLVTVNDTEPPRITCPPPLPLDNVIISATGIKTNVYFTGIAAATAEDNVDSNPKITYNPASGSEFSLGTTPVTVTASDSSGNVTNCTFQVIVKDKTPPQITCPADITPSAPVTGGKTKVDFAAIVKDNVDPDPRVIYDPPSGSDFWPGTTEVRVTATDDSNNLSTCSFRVIIPSTVDIEPPQITCPSLDGMVIPATGRLTRVSYTVTATDKVDPRPQITYNHAPNSDFSIGTTMVNVTATDFSGNYSTCYFWVTVKDTDPPRVFCPGTVTATAKGSSRTRVNFEAQAIDNVDTVCQIVYNPSSGSEFPLGTTLVRVTATDSSGNSSNCTFQVLVTEGGNSSPKINSSLVPSGTMTVSATGSRTRVSYALTATDDDDPHPVISYDPESGSEFPLGTTSVTATATDSSGNSSTYTFFVTVKDATPPQILCPPLDGMTVPATGSKTRVDFSATANDNVDSNPQITYDHAPGSEFAPGTTLVTATATDSSGNSSRCTFSMTVKDTTPPQILCPADMTVPATGRLTRVDFSATANDNVDSNPQITYDHPPGSEFQPGTTSVKVTATDSSGNFNVCSFKVTIKGTSPFQIICPADMTVPATGELTKVNFSAIANDVDGNPQITYNHAPGSEFPVGTTLVTATATDSSGNSSACSFSVTVKDTIPPQITCPSDMFIPATGQLTKVNFTAAAIDNVDPRPEISYDPEPGSEFPAGPTSVKVTASDKSGNISTCTFKITVQDTAPPEVTLSLGEQTSYDTTYGSGSGFQQINNGASDEQIPYYTTQSVLLYYTVDDNCDSDPQVKVELSNNNDKPLDIKSSSPITVDLAQCAGKNVVTLTATDACGNMEKASVSFEVALKLEEGQVSIKPETLRVRPGAFTVSLSFPSPYDAATVYDVNADGAKHKAIVYNPTTQKAICDFKRADINMVPLDPKFDVTGFFMYKDTACKFYGSDTIRTVRRPTKNGQLLGTGQSIRGGQSMDDCQWPFCNRLESLFNR